MRRTAQVLMGKALQSLGDSRDVKAALNSALAELSVENNTISLAQLRQADSQTTAAIIRAFSDNAVFREVSLRTPNLRSLFAITYHHYLFCLLIHTTLIALCHAVPLVKSAAIGIVHEQHCWTRRRRRKKTASRDPNRH